MELGEGKIGYGGRLNPTTPVVAAPRLRGTEAALADPTPRLRVFAQSGGGTGFAGLQEHPGDPK